MNIYEQKEVKALEDEIDKLFVDLKRNIYDITVARRNWLDKVKGWLGFVGKSPVYRQQYPESRLGLSLHQYAEIKGLIGNLEGQLNEVGATDLLGHEYVDDILDAFRDKLKTIVRTHVDAISRSAPTPPPAAPPAVPKAAEPSMPAEPDKDILGPIPEPGKKAYTPKRRTLGELGHRPKISPWSWEKPRGDVLRRRGGARWDRDIEEPETLPAEPEAPEAPEEPEEEAREESPEAQAAKAEKKAAAKATQNEMRLTFSSEDASRELLKTPEGKLHALKNVFRLLNPQLDIAMKVLGIPAGEKRLGVKEKKMRIRASLKQLIDEPSKALSAAAKQVEEEPEVSPETAAGEVSPEAAAGEVSPEPEKGGSAWAMAAAEHEDPTFEKKVADKIKIHIGELGDNPTKDEVIKLGAIAHTIATMGGKKDLTRLDDEVVLKRIIQELVPDISDIDDEKDKEDYFNVGKRILGYMKSKEESIQNQVDKYKKLLREDYRPEILRKQVAKLSISEKVNFYCQKLASFRDRS